MAATDPDGVVLEYTYDADGNLTDTLNSTNPTIPHVHVEYEKKRGFKKWVDDPDVGHWEYTYNSFGEVVRQVDAKNQPTTMTHDGMGRVVTQDRRDRYRGVVLRHRRQWGGQARGDGERSRSRARRGMQHSADESQGGASRAGRYFTYKWFGKVQGSFECIDGELFITTYEYDTAGRPERDQIPSRERLSTGGSESLRAVGRPPLRVRCGGQLDVLGWVRTERAGPGRRGVHA